MREVIYHHAKFGGARISPAAGVAKNVEFFVCLFVCLFVRHAFERAPCSTYSDCCQLATTLNAEVQKKGKKLGFVANRGRENKPIETKFGRLAYIVGLL